MTSGGGAGPPALPRQRADLAAWAALVGTGLAGTGVAVAAGFDPGTASAPFLGEYRLAVGPASLLAPAVAVGVVAAVQRGALERLSWRVLLCASYLAALAWELALALVDGRAGLSRGITDPAEFRADVGAVDGDPVGFLREFVAATPSHAAATRGHPPGPVLLLWALDRLGPVALGLLVAALGAAAVPLVLSSVRGLGGELAARRFAPVLVLAPYAVWTAVSLDAVVSTLDAGMVAAGVAASAAHRRGWTATGWAALAGLLLGVAALFSYTAPWVGLSLVCVYFVRRRAFLNVVTGACALVPVLAARAAGFSWFDGLVAARDDFDLRVEPDRPALAWAGLSVVVLLVACGPALVASARKVLRTPGWPFLVGGAAAVAFALAAGLARGGMEHAWLPFFPWLLVAAVAPQRQGGEPVRSPVLLVAVGAAVAIAIEAVLATAW
jgi:hypothetical protein